MRTLLLVLAFSSPAFATHIHDTNVLDASGRAIITGTISVCPPSSFSSGTWWISKDCIPASITKGVLDIPFLAPGTYRAHWVTPAIEDQQWLVTDSVTPLRIEDIRNTRTGHFCGEWVGGTQISFETCSTIPGTLLWSTLGNSDWSTLDNSGWAALGN